MPYSDAELDEMLLDLESQLVERKRSGADRSSIRRNICAFANDLAGHGQPGVVIIGVDDDGGCAGVEIDDQLLSTLAQMRQDGNLLPIPSLTVEKRTLAGCRVAVVTVEPSRDPPVRYQGRVFVKVGPTTQAASAEEEQQLIERRRAGDRPFDMRPALDASDDDLDLDYVRQQYLPRAVAADVLEHNRRPLDQQLRSLRLHSQGSPTWGALLGMGRDPQAWIPGAYVQFVRFDGPETTDAIANRKELTGRLEDVLRRLDELFDLSVSTRTDITSRARESSHPDYPIVALQQLARNAVMHRSYEGTNAPIRVYWFSDRVEISSPGGLYGKVTPETFGRGDTDYRNPLVAEMMHHLGFAQRFGIGVPLARSELSKNGNPAPEFDLQPTRVTVTLRPAS